MEVTLNNSTMGKTTMKTTMKKYYRNLQWIFMYLFIFFLLKNFPRKFTFKIKEITTNFLQEQASKSLGESINKRMKIVKKKKKKHVS